MNHRFRSSFVALLLAAAAVGGVAVPTSHALAEEVSAGQVYQKASKAMVAVQYTWESEAGKRELIGPGVVVSDDGLVMSPIAIIDVSIPDVQVKEFKIIVPQTETDHKEIDAEFVGRDERTSVAFFRAKESLNVEPVKFEDVPVEVGDEVYSVGMLPKNAGYRTYLASSLVAGKLRGPTPIIAVTSGGLAAIGAPVFNTRGQAIGFVNVQTAQPTLPVFDRNGQPTGLVSLQPTQTAFLSERRDFLTPITIPPAVFVPASDFMLSFTDPIKPGEPQALPWTGFAGLKGLKKELAEFYNLAGQPAVEVGDVIPNTPADKAGFKQGMIITQVNGRPLTRGDEPEELEQILGRELRRMKVGDEVAFMVIPTAGAEPVEMKLTLEEQPPRSNIAARYTGEDLGFTVRDIVFQDTYVLKQPADFKGVVVSYLKPNSNAQAAGLRPSDVITEVNGTAVQTIEDFRATYEQLRKLNPRDNVVFVVLRGGNATEVIRVEPPQN